MTDQTKPTDADYSRDLHADLAIAEAATPGPWYGGGFTVGADGMAGIWEWTGDDRGLNRPDARAIASNRQAAPAAMRRAIEAEEAILAWSDTLDAPIDEWEDGVDYMDRASEALDRMEALAQRIRAARKGGEKP